MSTITTPGTKPGLKRFQIRICTGGETAIQTAVARTSGQAWNMAFDLAERLLGDQPPRKISVKQPSAVGRPVACAGRGHAPIVVQVDAPLGVTHLPVKTDRFDLLG